LGLPLSVFPELDRYGGSEWVNEELSGDNESEEQLRAEERADQVNEILDQLGLDPSEPTEETSGVVVSFPNYQVSSFFIMSVHVSDRLS